MENMIRLLSLIRNLNGLQTVPRDTFHFSISGKLELSKLWVVDEGIKFELLVPTDPYDIWDYIWRSERDAQSTDKVQLFQAGVRIVECSVTAISREGQSDLFDFKGPDRYRLQFFVPFLSFISDAPLELRFYFRDRLMSIAGG